MRFKGQLLLPGESGPGLKVNLDVAEHHLAVESDGGGLGAWPLEAVDVERLHGDLFSLTVAGEALRFVADDTIGFAYSAVPAIEKMSGRSRGRSNLRSMFGWLRGPEKPARPVAVEPSTVEATPPAPTDEPTPADNDDWIDVSDGLPPTEAWQEFVIDEALEAEPSASAISQPAPPGVHDEVPPEADIGAPTVEGPLVQDPVNRPPAPTLEPAAAVIVPDGEQCAGVRSDGRRCESQILTESGYCYPHDPRRAFEDGYRAAQDARAQLKKDATARLNRIYSRLDKAMRQVERGELDPETAMAMAQLARTMCAILEMDDTEPDQR